MTGIISPEILIVFLIASLIAIVPLAITAAILFFGTKPKLRPAHQQEQHNRAVFQMKSIIGT